MPMFRGMTVMALLMGPAASYLFAQFTLAKTTSNATPTAGGAAFSYTLVLTNTGGAASFVKVVDPLPAGVIFQNVSVAGAPMSCFGPPVGTAGVVICENSFMAAGGVSTITIVAQIVPNVASGVRTNTATVVSGTLTTSGSVQQNIQVNAPLSITKAGPPEIRAGDNATYKITVTNSGNSTALNATIQDTLPAGTTFVSVEGTGAFHGTCDFNGGIPGAVTCASVDIPSGLHTLNITVKTEAGVGGSLSNTATITTAGTGTIVVGSSTTTATLRVPLAHHHTSQP